MSRRPSCEGWDAVGPRYAQYGPRKGKPMCQSVIQTGYWKGCPCSNPAKHEVYRSACGDGEGFVVISERIIEVCCPLHIPQALSRNSDAQVRRLEWAPR